MATSSNPRAATLGGRALAVARSLGSTLLWTAVMVAVVLLISGGPFKAGDALEFSVKDISGQPAQSQAQGSKPTVLYFWATWCSACKLTTGTVEGFAARNPEITVLAVTPESPALIRQWADERGHKPGPGSLRYVAQGGTLLRKLGVTSFPTTVVLDSEGKVAWNRSGVLIPGELDLRL